MKVLTLGVVITLIASPVLAAKTHDDEPNNCERLHIQIGNVTSKACQLVKSKVNHGNLVSAPPATIPAGFTMQFDIKQSFKGPDIELQYQCDNETITFRSQQNYCFMKAGKISGSIISSTANIHGSYTKEEGSYYWSKPGFINWVFS